MIEIEDVLAFHEKLIQAFGGISGLRSRELLESAILRPYQTFDGQELYPSVVNKAAAIIESIVKNHPFLDGNKRTGYVLMRLTLMQNAQDIESSEDEKYKFVIQIASGDLEFEEIRTWIQNRIGGK